MMWGGGSFMWVGWIIIALIAFLLIKWAFNRGGSRDMSSDMMSTQLPLDILKARYARGEINKDEFEQMKRDLLR